MRKRAKPLNLIDVFVSGDQYFSIEGNVLKTIMMSEKKFFKGV